MIEQKEIEAVKVKVLTIEKKILKQIPFRHTISKEEYEEKIEILGSIDIETYNEITKGYMRIGTQKIALITIEEEPFLIPFTSYMEKTVGRKTKNIYII